MSTRVPSVLITGASRGIGRGLALAMLERGWQVEATTTSLKVLQQKEPALLTSGISWHELDQGRQPAVAQFIHTLKTRQSRFQMLVNNAGIYSGEPDRIFAVNFFGLVQLTSGVQALLPENALIANISSGMGSLDQFSKKAVKELLRPDLELHQLEKLCQAYCQDRQFSAHHGWPGNPYSASKAALNAYSRIANRDRQHSGQRVISICPGWVKTDMGGPAAPRSIPTAISGILDTILHSALTGGQFYRDGRPIPW
ncbi:MAG: SDR family NAD(P)-dependent oxidoreductase [Leptospiraceae bacterium]|nr:SDR family NAD(P)-dependent oxidoreductase [Leptospiraceae bacterium]